jgi:hypothetical protein
MAGLALAACSQEYEVGKLNVKGVFLQTEIAGTPVYIKCAGELKRLFVEVYPGLSKYVGPIVYCTVS